MVSKAIYGAVAVIAVIIIVGIAVLVSIDNESVTSTKESVVLDVTDSDEGIGVIMEDKMTSDLPDIVDVGVMLPNTNSMGVEYFANGKDIQLAVNDFNAYLREIGAHWRMNLIKEDTFTDPIIALEKIQPLNSQGIKLVIGPQSSLELRNIKSYADSNNMVLISPTSTSSDLAIDDNIFRMIPDDTHQSKVLAMLFLEQDIKVVIPIYYGDVWGDVLYESVKNNFESLGGVMDEGIRYSPRTVEYSTEANLLSNLINKYTAEYSTDDIAVLMLGYSETVHLLNYASEYDNLREIRWFGSDGSSNDSTLSDDAVAAVFTEDVNFVSTQFTASTNEIYTHVKNHFIDSDYSRAPSIYVYPLYDSVFILGKTILATDSIDPLIIRDALPDVAATHIGATGTINLNEFGDRTTADYALWTIRDGEWVEYGRFNSESKTFDYYMIDK